MARCREIILFIFLGHFSIVRTTENVTVNETSKEIMHRCIVDLLSSKTQFNSVLVVVDNADFSDDLLRQIHALMHIKICVKDYDVSMKVTPTTYLIRVQNKTFEDLIDSLDRDWYRKPEALYILIMDSLAPDGIVAVFRLLWEYHLINILVIVDDIEGDASIYSYFPYAEGRCGRDYNNTVKLCDCKDMRQLDIFQKLGEFDKPRLDNCTLNVATRNYPPLVLCDADPDPDNKYVVGIERFLVELLLERENISLNYTCLPETKDVGNVFDNFTVTGIMEKLYENEVELLFGGFSVNNRRSHFFDFLCAHLAYEDMYVAATPSADLVERWKMVYVMFHANVGLLLLLILVLCAILLTNFTKLRIQNTNDCEILNLLGNATQNIPLLLRERLFKNFIIIHWLWFIFFINCFYQTRLTSFTTYRIYKPQLNQYHSLEHSNIIPCMPWDVVRFLKNSGQVPIINEQYLHMHNCETADLALDEVAKRNNKYTVTMYMQYLWWTRKHLKDANKIHLMEENIYNNLYALFFKRGFPLLRKLHAKMTRLPEHGFVQGAKEFHRLPRDFGSRADKIFGQTSIKVKDLFVPFVILGTGLVVALLTFIIEMFYSNK